MNFQEAQQSFFDKHGFYPSDDVIQDFLAEEEYEEDRQTRFSFQPTRYDYDDGAGELLSLFKESFRGIKNSARKSFNTQKDMITEQPYLNEFFFLLLIFLSKASLYFLLKRTHEIGLDVSDF